VEPASAIKPCRRPGTTRQPGWRARAWGAPERRGLPLVLGDLGRSLRSGTKPPAGDRRRRPSEHEGSSFSP